MKVAYVRMTKADGTVDRRTSGDSDTALTDAVSHVLDLMRDRGLTEFQVVERDD